MSDSINLEVLSTRLGLDEFDLEDAVSHSHFPPPLNGPNISIERRVWDWAAVLRWVRDHGEMVVPVLGGWLEEHGYDRDGLDFEWASSTVLAAAHGVPLETFNNWRQHLDFPDGRLIDPEEEFRSLRPRREYPVHLVARWVEAHGRHRRSYWVARGVTAISPQGMVAYYGEAPEVVEGWCGTPGFPAPLADGVVLWDARLVHQWVLEHHPEAVGRRVFRPPHFIAKYGLLTGDVNGWKRWRHIQSFPAPALGESDRWHEETIERWVANEGPRHARFHEAYGVPVWGPGSIASRMGVDVKTARTWTGHETFPRPLDGPGGRLWDEREVERWLAEYGGSGEDGTPRNAPPERPSKITPAKGSSRRNGAKAFP